MIKTEVEIINRISTGAILEACRAVTLGYAVLVQAKLNEDKPAPPARGSMKWKSEKQRRFVMANWKQGKLKIPYVRGTGNGLNGSQTLNRSYRVDLQGDSAVLMSSASYAPYVVGDQQAEIHKGRWKTARMAATEVHQSGDLQYIADKLFTKFQP
jgi:hypothetical protein